MPAPGTGTLISVFPWLSIIVSSVPRLTLPRRAPGSSGTGNRHRQPTCRKHVSSGIEPELTWPFGQETGRDSSFAKLVSFTLGRPIMQSQRVACHENRLRKWSILHRLLRQTSPRTASPALCRFPVPLLPGAQHRGHGTCRVW